MSDNYRPQTTVDWTSSDAYSQFKLWRKEVERIIGGPLVSRSDKVKINHIFIWAGAHAETLIEARQNEDPDLRIETPTALLDQLASCLTHTTFFREAREEFYNVRQKAGENITTFFSRIMDLYRQAEFPANTQFLVVDKLIHGCTNRDCKRKLMTKGKDVSVKDCLEVMRTSEAVEHTMKRLGDPSENQVNTAYARDPTKKSQRNGSKRQQSTRKPRGHNNSQARKTCIWCKGDIHSRDQCPAKDARCRFCSKEGHFERACLKKKRQEEDKDQHAVELHSDQDSSESDEYDLGTVSVHAIDNNKSREVFAPISIHSTTAQSAQPVDLKGKVDTGAMISCIPLTMLKIIGVSKTDLKHSDAIIKGISGADLQNCGTLDVKVTCNDITDNTTFYITKRQCPVILGLEFCKRFGLVTIAPVCMQRSITVEPNDLDAVHITDESEMNYHEMKQKWNAHLPLGRKTGDPLQDLKEIFPEAFDGKVGLFEGEVDLKLSPDAKPVQLPPRAVPQSIMPKLKKELDKMEQQGIIRACPETTDWVHNLVVVVKKNGDLRLCLDPRNLNKYLIRNVHYTASWEDAQHSFKDGQFFSKLDAKSGYWTKKLAEESQLLTAFNTPFKKYCFIRLPFGLSVSSEIFSEQMDKTLAGVPGTFPCADDVKIQGSTEERHDIHLLETVERAHQAGLKFNPDKCAVKKRQIEYFGRVITPQGVEPASDKVEAIMSMSAPTDKTELQSLLGAINFLSTFIPNLSKKTHLMRGLLKNGVHFTWTSDMQKELDTIKNDITGAVKLIHYDPNKPATIETDASLKGLGAVLIQDGRPVRFLSKSLTPAEAEYSNIERELLAVLFACEKLHTYTFGRKTIVHTDHKPLESIFLKPVSLAPARLQRMLLRLSKYDITVKYVGAKSVLLADTLSRLVTPGRSRAIPGLDISIAQVLKVEPTRLESIQEQTKVDPTLVELKDLIMTGWPDSMQDLPETLRHYWCFRDELTVLDGLVMKGNRIVIPKSMQADTLDRLHDAHQGLTSTLQRARRVVYWPRMQDDITELIQKCEECQIHGNKKPRPPERQMSATRPMETTGMDLLDYEGRHALVTVDYFSGFLTYDPLRSETSKAVITALNNIYRKFGLSEKILSDNGPCFKSEEFENFCHQLDIKHVTSSPHYHESNGRAERAIATIKQILKKSKNDLDITKALIAYNDTPVSHNLPSPAELFLGRGINTRLSMSLSPAPLTADEKMILSDRRSAHLKSPKERGSYATNQPVWFTEDGTVGWRAGNIQSRDNAPNSYWIIDSRNDRRIRRNHHDIKPRYTDPPDQQVLHHHEDRAHRPPILPNVNESRPSDPRQDTPPISSETGESSATCAGKASVSDTEPASPMKPLPVRTRLRSGLAIKPHRDPDFVY